MVNQAHEIINDIATKVEEISDHNEKDKIFSYHGLQPMVLRSTKTTIEESFEPIKEKEYSTGEEVVVNGEESTVTIKKVTVALAGGSMIVVGIPLIPLPGKWGLTIYKAFSYFANT